MPTELTRPILAFFYDKTCGACRRQDSVIEHFLRDWRDTLAIARIEVSERPDLAERFSITQAPTVLLLDSVIEHARIEGRATHNQMTVAFADLLGDTTADRLRDEIAAQPAAAAG